ncbi:hypothetical protein [Rhodopila sp.]|uniref:hypothetical protein n=1 Tax=Rhodopila sp. TaxID=2480087 RepID=UPI003D133250
MNVHRLACRLASAAVILAALSGCGPSYSSGANASNAVERANKVEPGVVVGVRRVGVSALGKVSATSVLGGSLMGGIAGSVEHVSADTKAFEYIVRKSNNNLVSVTQKDKVSLTLGQKVLVIAGTQARVVPDDMVPPDSPAKHAKVAEARASVAPDMPTVISAAAAR